MIPASGACATPLPPGDAGHHEEHELSAVHSANPPSVAQPAANHATIDADMRSRVGASQLALIQKLEGTRKAAATMQRKVGDVSKHLAELHGVLASVLAQARINQQITALEEQEAVRGLEELLHHTPSLQQTLQAIIHHTDGLEHLRTGESWGDWSKRQASEWTSWAKGSVNPRVAGAVCLGLCAMAAKNGAWYLPSLISAKEIPFDAVSGMAKVFFERWITANVAAGAAEYPASVISQKMFRSTGNSMNEFLALLQLGDMVSAYTALKITGQKISAYEGLGLASVAFAALVRTGTFGKIWQRVGVQPPHENRAITLPPADGGAALDAGQASAPGATDRDPESLQPTGAAARADASLIGQLFSNLSNETWAARVTEVGSLMGELEQLQSLGAGQPPEMPAPAAGRTAAPARTNEIGSLADMVSRVEEQLHSQSFHDYQQALGRVTGTQGDGQAVGNLDQLRNHLAEIKHDLDNHGGKNPKTIGFAIGMLMAYVVPIVLANAGQTTAIPALQSPLTRGALNIMGSVSAQTAANLGHFLLKDKPLDSKLLQNIKSVGMSIGLTPTEFIPLVLGLLYMDKANDLAAGAGDEHSPWPRAGTLRVFQELGRSFYSTMFTNLVTGTPITKNDIAGILVQLGGAGLATGLDYRQQKTQ